MNSRPITSTELNVCELGLGCAALGNLYTRIDDQDAAETLSEAWRSGMRYFDTAPHYGHGRSEARLGHFLQNQKREEFQLSSKVGRTLVPVEAGQEPDHGFIDPLPFRQVFDYSAAGVFEQVESSAQRLRVDTFDILYVHDIGRLTHGSAHAEIMQQALDGAFPALARLKEQGRVNAVGIGVNEIDVCMEVLEKTDIDVILLAGRYSLLEQEPLLELFPLCAEKAVSIVIGGPYNSGLLAGGTHYDYLAAPDAIMARRDKLADVCLQFDVPLPAAALQFALAHPLVVSVIPGARSTIEVKQNVEFLNKPIPRALWTTLKENNLIHKDAPVPTWL